MGAKAKKKGKKGGKKKKKDNKPPQLVVPNFMPANPTHVPIAIKIHHFDDCNF